MFDLNAYFARIQWRDPAVPNLETLTRLIDAHIRHIPFENLDVLLGRPIRLDLESLQNKLVKDRRGGYCFEHVTLFAAVLEAVGFQPVRHGARVILFEPRTEAPRGHMFLTVRLDEVSYIIDPGFAAFAPGFPVPLVDIGASWDGQSTHWMVREGKLWALNLMRDGQPVAGWITSLEQENLIDFEVANHYISTHPSSPFTNVMMLSAATPEGRVNVMNRNVTVISGAAKRCFVLADRAALRALLNTHFGFDFPDVENLVIPAIPEWQRTLR